MDQSLVPIKKLFLSIEKPSIVHYCTIEGLVLIGIYMLTDNCL